MTLEIPNERQDEREEHLHEEEKAKHIKDRRGEYYQERREDRSHDADRYDRTLRDEIHFAEKGKRREQNVADSEIKETVDTELRNED